ncbi:MAG: chitobiase/beta-hexosaminidase C-terminal domain-containing protein, partial [Spirochaetota bacterium]
STVGKPTFSVAGGQYAGVQSVEITTNTAGATIYYTIDGSAPSNTSTAYSDAISVADSMTIKAYAVKEGMTDSAVAEASYTITSLAVAASQAHVTGALGGGVETGSLTVTPASGFEGETATVTASVTGATVRLSLTDPRSPGFDATTDAAESLDVTMTSGGVTIYYLAELEAVADPATDLTITITGATTGGSPATETITIAFQDAMVAFTTDGVITYVRNGASRTISAEGANNHVRVDVVRVVGDSIYLGGAVSTDGGTTARPALWVDDGTTVTTTELAYPSDSESSTGTAMTSAHVSVLEIAGDGTAHIIVSDDDVTGNFAYWVDGLDYMTVTDPSTHGIAKSDPGNLQALVSSVTKIDGTIYQVGAERDSGDGFSFTIWKAGAVESSGLGFAYDPFTDASFETQGFFLDTSATPNEITLYGVHDVNGNGSVYEVGTQLGTTGTPAWTPEPGVTIYAGGTNARYYNANDYWFTADQTNDGKVNRTLTLKVDGVEQTLGEPIAEAGVTADPALARPFDLIRTNGHDFVAGIYDIDDGTAVTREIVVWRDNTVVFRQSMNGGYSPWQGRLVFPE